MLDRVHIRWSYATQLWVCYPYLNDDSNNALNTLHDYCIRTFLCGLSWTVSYGVLCLHTEKECRSKVLIGQDAGCEGVVGHPRLVLLQVIPVCERDEPPDEAEDQPGQHEAGHESQEGVSPLEIQDCNKNILKLIQSKCAYVRIGKTQRIETSKNWELFFPAYLLQGLTSGMEIKV